MTNETYLLCVALLGCAAVAVLGAAAALKYRRLAEADVLLSTMRKCLKAFDAAKAVKMCAVADSHGASGALRYRRIILTINRSSKATFDEAGGCKKELAAEMSKNQRGNAWFFALALLPLVGANAMLYARLAPEWAAELLAVMTVAVVAVALRYAAWRRLRKHADIEMLGLNDIATTVAAMTDANRKQAGVNHMAAD